MSASAPLHGVRVLDFGRYIAGPYCAALLADLGADVIRIDKPGGSEDRYICPVTDAGEGTMFLHVNRNKRGITLDCAAPEGRDIVRRLAATADVVVANMPEDSLAALGLDYDSLRAVRPDIILSAQNAFGATGPYAARPGFDGVAQAMSGAVYLSGQPGAPMKSYASWADFGTAVFAAYGTLAAVLHRAQTGQGQRVETALLRTALSFFHFNNMEQYLTGKDRTATGNRSQFGGPADLFPTRDGWIQVQVIGQGLFRRWCNLVGEADWPGDPRFANDDLRSANGGVLSARMAAWTSARTTDEALTDLQAAHLPAGPLLSPQAVFDDPHVRQSGLMTPVAYPGLAQPAPMIGCPVHFSAVETPIRLPPPALGQDTDAIMAELGYTTAEIGSFRTKAVI